MSSPLNQNLNQIKEIVEEFFNKLTVDVQIELSTSVPNVLSVQIKADEPQFLIGQQGQMLFDIQRVLGAILKRKIGEQFYLDLDINDYKKKKTDYLQQTARALADDVSLSKKERYLPPMPPSERRVVHLELAGRTDVTTASIGEEPKRRVVIRPYP
jgi:spoIIIJ-associated protein